MREIISLKESNGKRYLTYDFTYPIKALKTLQNTKHLFLDAENKPIVIIDASFEGETGSYLDIALVRSPRYHCGSGLGSPDEEGRTTITGDHAGSFNILRALHDTEAGLCEYDSDKIVLVYGDANIEENYNSWLKVMQDYHEIKIKKVFGKCIYGPETLMNEPLERAMFHNQYIPNKSFKHKHFISLNGTPKAHRFEMVELLFSNGWADKGFISFLNKGGPAMNIYGTSSHKLTEHFQAQTLELDYTSDEIGEEQFNLPPQYNKACFDIVTESVVDDRGIFITEKTWKPILNETPFIPLGPKGMCRFLEEYFGIKPYTDLFDYSFDNFDYPERLHKLKEDNLERLINMDIKELNEIVYSQKMQELLAYNKRQLLSFGKHLKPNSMLGSPTYDPITAIIKKNFL